MTSEGLLRIDVKCVRIIRFVIAFYVIPRMSTTIFGFRLEHFKKHAPIENIGVTSDLILHKPPQSKILAWL